MSRGQYPATRMRRNRMTAFSRRLARESRLSRDDLIWPVFVAEDKAAGQEIEAMPGVVRHGIGQIAEVAKTAVRLGIPAIAIFPSIEPEEKSDDGKLALNKNNLVCRAIRAAARACPELGIVCDVALDPFTAHGHDGIVRDGEVVNDATIDILCRQAVVQANAGCHIIAPSDMMDGRVGAIRRALDKAGHQNVQIMAYASKYASGFYGPFREAVRAGKTASTQGKASYQMDPANGDEAMHEIALDLAEGADMVIIKPGMPYLDILYRAKTKFQVPCVAYQVSGEYAMITQAGRNGWIDHDRVMMESLVGFKRAGANAIITYFAPQAAELLAAETS